MTVLVYLVSMALAHTVTNLDNLALMLVLASTSGSGRVGLAYAVSQICVLLIAAVFSSAIFSVAGNFVSLLGFIPIALGLYALSRRAAGGAPSALPLRVAFGAALMTFLGLSVDTFSVFAPILSDGNGARDTVAFLGALLSVTLLSLAPLLLSRGSRRWLSLTARLERLGPFVMIAAGVFVLLDTPLDTR